MRANQLLSAVALLWISGAPAWAQQQWIPGTETPVPASTRWEHFKGLVLANTPKGVIAIRGNDDYKAGEDFFTHVNGQPIATARELVLAVSMASGTLEITTIPTASQKLKSPAEQLAEFSFRDTPGGVMITRSSSQADIGWYVISIQGKAINSARDALATLTRYVGSSWGWKLSDAPTVQQKQATRNDDQERLASSDGAEDAQLLEEEERDQQRQRNREAIQQGLANMIGQAAATRETINGWKARDAEQRAVREAEVPVYQAPSYSAPAPSYSAPAAAPSAYGSRVASNQSFSGRDATSCVSMQSRGGQRHFVNTCSQAISMNWCYVGETSNDPSCQNYHNSLSLSPGGKWPINQSAQYYYAACLGANTIRSAGGRRHNCAAE